MRFRRFWLAALICMWLGACGRQTEIGEPVRVPLETADVAVAAQIEQLLAAVEQAPRAAQPRAALGMAYEVAGWRRAAHACYEQAAELDPSEPKWSYYQAQAEGELGDLEAALRTMGRVQTLDDSYVPAYLFRGRWLLDLGRVEEAGPVYRKAADLEPGNLAAFPIYGLT